MEYCQYKVYFSGRSWWVYSYPNLAVNILIITSGSVYLLMLVACCNMRKLIINLSSSLVSHLSSLIWYPSFGKSQNHLYCSELENNRCARKRWSFWSASENSHYTCNSQPMFSSSANYLFHHVFFKIIKWSSSSPSYQWLIWFSLSPK